MKSENELTQLLARWKSGEQEAFESLFAAVYEELRKLASGYMRRERPGHTLQTTALVNEAYMRLAPQGTAPGESRLHFFALAAKVMRQILIDHARSRNMAKRGAGAIKLSLDEAVIVSDERAAELVALDDALSELARIDPRQSQIVEMRFFGGLTVDEVAQVLNISSDTVNRDWKVAKAWLYRRISS